MHFFVHILFSCILKRQLLSGKNWREQGKHPIKTVLQETNEAKSNV